MGRASPPVPAHTLARAAGAGVYGATLVKRATHNGSIGRRRPRPINGVIAQPDGRASADPYGRLPTWARPIPGEDIKAYGERLGLKIHMDSLSRSLAGDTAAHAKWREQALKGLGLGQMMHVDVNARDDREWLRGLTDDELLVLKRLKDEALARLHAPKALDSAEEAVSG